jgi:hypothetical protein
MLDTKVPYCMTCNGLLADEFETPLSKLLAKGYRAVADHLIHKGPSLLFRWLALIFLKTLER